MDTFGEFLERAYAAGVIDFSLRVVKSPEGLTDFYIHPSDRDGETGDFHVSAAFVTKLPHGAGSSRPTMSIAGSGSADRFGERLGQILADAAKRINEAR